MHVICHSEKDYCTTTAMIYFQKKAYYYSQSCVSIKDKIIFIISQYYKLLVWVDCCTVCAMFKIYTVGNFILSSLHNWRLLCLNHLVFSTFITTMEAVTDYTGNQH